MSTTARLVRAAVEDATRAASIHNSQPWHFVLEGADAGPDSRPEIQVWLDANRPPHFVDPEGRWAVQSIGAALANLQLSLRHRLHAHITLEELPRGGWMPPKGLGWEGDLGVAPQLRELAHAPLAVVTWDGQHGVDAVEELLFGAIEHRYTSREPFQRKRVSARLWGELTGVGTVGETASGGDEAQAGTTGSGTSGAVWTTPVTPEFALAFLDVTATVEQELVGDPAYLLELEEWVGHHGREGIPRGAAGSHDRAGHYPGRDFSLTVGHPESHLPEADFEDVPQLAVIHSAGDTPLDWLHAGQAMERVALRATAGGLQVGILGQAIEDEDAHRKVSELFTAVAGQPRVVQQVLRLGYGSGRRPATTPRRRVRDVFTVV